MKNMRIHWRIVLLLACLFVLPRYVSGQSQTLNGRVRIPLGQGSFLVVDVPGQRQQLNLNVSTIVVTRDGRPAQIADLQAGDFVTLQVGPGNVVQRLDARNAGAAGAGLSWIIAGRVDDNNEGTLTLMTTTGRQQFTVPPGAYVAREGHDAELGVVRTNDSVVVVISSTGDVQAVFAQPAARDYRLEGTAGSIDRQTLSLRAGARSIRLRVQGPGIPVKRNGQNASLASIRPNDHVMIRFDPQSRPLALEAGETAGLLDRVNSRLLLLGLIPLLLLFAVYVWRRKQLDQMLQVLVGRQRALINSNALDHLPD